MNSGMVGRACIRGSLLVSTLGVASPAEMISPADGATIPACMGQITFEWSPGTGTEYGLWIGTTGVGSKNVFNSSLGANTSRTFPTGSVNGQTVYMRLWTRIGGAWQGNFKDYIYSTTGGVPVPDAVTHPPPNTTLTSTSQLFQWDPLCDATEYWVAMGTSSSASSPNMNDIYQSGVIPGSAFSHQVTGIPLTGQPVYLHLGIKRNGTWTVLTRGFST